MKIAHRYLAAVILTFVTAQVSIPQENKPANPAAAPPNLIVVVDQEIQQGKTAEHEKLEIAISRACDRLDVPSQWIDLQPLTGTGENLLLQPFDSFEQLGQSKTEWRQLSGTHPDLTRMREQIEDLVVSARAVVAFRRDDLSYLGDSIDLSEGRYMRVLDIRLFPGHENDFVEAMKILADAYGKIHADTPLLVYQVDAGLPTPAFFVFMPMPELKSNDDLLLWRANLTEAEGDPGAENLQKIAREAFASTETELYAVSPEMSHVSNDFAAGDMGFWKARARGDPPSPGSDKPSIPTGSR